MGAGASIDAISKVDGELARILGASNNDLAAAADKVTCDIEQLVPKTASGQFDPTRGDRDAVREVVDRATRLAAYGYAVSWEYYKRTDVEGLLADTSRLSDDFTPDEPPRCAGEFASAEALVALAARHGPALLESLQQYVQTAGGAFLWGPQKKPARIAQKAHNDYKDDLARVCDVERATGVFDSPGDLSRALALLRAASERGDITIRRCKDHFGQPFKTGYRDLNFNIELHGFVGELQLNLRRIVEVKARAHMVYEVQRVLEAGEGRDALRRAVEGFGVESEQALRLTIDGGRSIDDVFGSVELFEAALERALPPGCVVANVYSGDQGVVRVRLGLEQVAGVAKLRDDIIMGTSFEDALRRETPRWEEDRRPATDEELRALGFEARTSGDGKVFYFNRDSKVARRTRPTVPGAEVSIRVDRAAFLDSYARIMTRFNKLTAHQREKLAEVRAAKVAVLLSPAGGGKTFLAIQRLLEELRGDASAVVLFAARNTALALFACKWLVAASKKAAAHVVDRVHVLVEPFELGPQRVSVDGRRLVLDAVGEEVVKYALIVVDEAHHLVGDATLHKQLGAIDAASSKLLFLGDASQATATLERDAIARSLVDLPQDCEVAVAMLSEVVRSTKRIVSGAAAFQLEAGRKAETVTHTASTGPPLVARIFRSVPGDALAERYAREVVEALKAVRRQLADLDDLDDRVAVVGPNDNFVEKLREPLDRALEGRFELVDAATASAMLPREEAHDAPPPASVASGQGSTRSLASWPSAARSVMNMLNFGAAQSDEAASKSPADAQPAQADASRASPAVDGKARLVVDSIENMDGLERLVVICVGLDHVIDHGAGVLKTRSRLYRAMTRAQLAVAVVNQALPGGWLEFLGRVELSADEGFDDGAEQHVHAGTAADDIVGAVEEEPQDDVSQASSEELHDSEAHDGDERLPDHDADEADTPDAIVDAPTEEEKDERPTLARTMSSTRTAAAASEPPTKVVQSIWDTSAAVAADESHGDLRFMPFADQAKEQGRAYEERAEKERAQDGLNVSVRVRPFTMLDRLGVKIDRRTGTVELVNTDHATKRFGFTYAWWTAYNWKRHCVDGDAQRCEEMSVISQDDAHASAGERIKRELYAGSAVVLLAYGLSGSGKTFTVYGPDAVDSPYAWFKHERPQPTWGIVPRILWDIFQDHKDGWRVTMKYFQNVVDICRDLLSPTGEERPYKDGMRKDADGFMDIVWCRSTVLNSWSDFRQAFQTANARKAFAPTQFNPQSQRGHCIMVIDVTFPDENNPGMTKRGRIYVGDLSGTEPAGDLYYAKYEKVTEADGSTELKLVGPHKDQSKTKELQDQGKKINLSLSELAQFFMKMAKATQQKKIKPGRSIPGCNSFFLCKYLKDTILQAKTYLFCAIRPEVTYEKYTFATLCFAKNASTIKVSPKQAPVPPNYTTNTATLEGTTWKAKSWSGAAARGGDPDPYDDESTVEIAGGKISWTGGGGGGPYAVANLPATVRSPDSEEIKFSLNSGGDLVVEFGYASPATIVYARQGAPN